MIVKTKSKYNNKNEEKVSFEINNNIMKIIYTINGNDIICSFGLFDIFKQHGDYVIGLNRNKNALSYPMNIKISRDNNLFKEINELENVICNLHFGNSIDELLVISQVPVESECEVIGDKRVFDVILETYPDFQSKYNRRLVKKKILSELDCNESLSGLEAQVDYLTLVVKYLIDGDKEIKDKVSMLYPNAEKFFDICGSDNVLSIKPEHELFNEIKTQKEKIRKYQTKYYNTKSEVI